jgi:MFS family permease
MYKVESSGALFRAHKRLLARRRRGPGVSRVVVLLGLTSLFTDISSEMVAAVLPLYLVYTLGLTPFQFGIVDGLYQGAAALVRIGGGFAADRWQRHKEVAAFGYGLSAVCKLALLAVGSAWAALTAVVVLDRTGKGIRTAPRDALISLNAPRPQLATAFGVHRALDTTGAMLGPIVAFALLTLVPLGFDTIFVTSFCFALVGLGILVLFVDGRSRVENVDAVPLEPVRLRSAFALLRAGRFRTLVLIAGALSLMTMSDGFLYLGLQQRMDFDFGLFPLLYVGTAAVYMLLSAPIGRLADRVGRGVVFVGGYVLLLLVYSSLLLPTTGTAVLLLYLVLFGAYYAATEGVLMALASAVLPAELRASGLAVLVTTTSIGRLLASVVFGGLWTWFGLDAAVVAFAAGLALAMSVTALALVRAPARAAHA